MKLPLRVPRLDPLVVRFIINGLVATAVHFVALTVFLKSGLIPRAGVATAAAWVFGVTASYTGNRLMVFKSSRPVRHTLPYFLVLYAMVGGLHFGVMTVWTDYLGLPYIIGFIIATAGATVLSFLASRYLVFVERPEKP